MRFFIWARNFVAVHYEAHVRDERLLDAGRRQAFGHRRNGTRHPISTRRDRAGRQCVRAPFIRFSRFRQKEHFGIRHAIEMGASHRDVGVATGDGSVWMKALENRIGFVLESATKTRFIRTFSKQ